ncbi:MAG: 2-phospho-L-lactate transferase CofD family protein [Candidatus Omnitrophota bacterium]
MKNRLHIIRTATWVISIIFLVVNVSAASPLYESALRPSSSAPQAIQRLLNKLQFPYIKATRGVLIFDVDKTLGDKNMLFALTMRDTLIKLLQHGMKIVITTGQGIVLQHGRVVEDVLYKEKVETDGKLSYSIIEERRYRPIPDSLLKNLTIYANEGTQRYTYEDGKLVEDLQYRRGLLTREKIAELEAVKRSRLSDDEILVEDAKIKAQIAEILERVIKQIRDCGNAEDLRQAYRREGIVEDIEKEIKSLKKIEEKDRTQKQNSELKSLEKILEDILGNDDKLLDIIDKVKDPLKIIDRETQLAFKYQFEGYDIDTKLKRELIARLIRKRLEKDGHIGLKVTVSGGTTIGIIQGGVDKKTAVEDVIEKEDVSPQEIIYFGDEFTPGGNDEIVAAISDINAISVNINPETTPEGVMWAGMGPEATRATLGWILKELYEVSKAEVGDVEPVITKVRRQIRVHTRGGYFFTRDALSLAGQEIDAQLIKNLERMLREGFKINVISRKPIETEDSSFIEKIDAKLRRNLIIYCRLHDGRFQGYSFDEKGKRRTHRSSLKDKAEVVRKRLEELNIEPEECLYVGDSFQTGSDRAVLEDKEFSGRVNIVNVTSARKAPAENMTLTGKGPQSVGIIADWIVNDFLFNMKKFPLQRQKPIIELVVKRLFAQDSIRILKGLSRGNLEVISEALLNPERKHYLGSILGERGIQPLKDFIDAIRSGEQYHDESAVIKDIRSRAIESLRLITGKEYGDLLAVYNYDYSQLNKSIDRLMTETGGDWNKLVKAGTKSSDRNLYRRRLIKGRGEVSGTPQILLMVGGRGGGFLAGTLPFSEILNLKTKGFRVAMGVASHEDGSATRIAQDALYPYMGHVASMGSTAKLYSRLVSSGKRRVLRWRFGEQEGLLRPNIMTILNNVTDLARKINITGCDKEARIFDISGSFFKVKYDKGAFRFIDISTDKESALIYMDRGKGVSGEFLLAGNRFKVANSGEYISLVNASVALDIDWPFFCNSMLRLSGLIDEKLIKDNLLSIEKGSVGNFAIIGNNTESGVYTTKSSKKDGKKRLVKLSQDEVRKAYIKPEEYSKALLSFSEALGITNGFPVLTTLEKATLYAKLNRVVLLGATRDSEPLFIDIDDRNGYLPKPQIAENGEVVSFQSSGRGEFIVKVGSKEARYKESNLSNPGSVYTEGEQSKVSLSTVALGLKAGEELVVGQADVTITAKPLEGKISLKIEKRDFKTGKTMTVYESIPYGDRYIFYAKNKNEKPLLGTSSFRIEKDASGNLQAFVSLDRMGQGTMVRIGNTDIIFKPRLVMEERNITHSLHLSSIEEIGFINGVKPKANPEFLRLIRETEDAIAMGPGSFDTSLMPILLIEEIVEALIERRRQGLPVIFISNPYCENGAKDYTITSIINCVERITGRRFEEIFSHIIINRSLDPKFIREEIKGLKDISAKLPEGSTARMARIKENIQAKEAELKKAESILSLYNEMHTLLNENPKKLSSRDPADSDELVSVLRGALEATDEEVIELGKRGVSVYREALADIVEVEVRQAGAAGSRKYVGYRPESIAHVIDEILYENASLKENKEWSDLLAAHDSREEELKGMLEEYVRKTGSTYIEAISKLSERVAMQESEIAELPELPKVLITNVNYTLIRGMDTKMRNDTAKNVAEYLRTGRKIIMFSGIGLNQMMEWVIKPLGKVLGQRDKHLLENIILAPYSGMEAFRFDEKGELHKEPLYNISKEIEPEAIRIMGEEVDGVWSLLTAALDIKDPDQASFDILGGKKSIEMPLFEKRSDAEYFGRQAPEEGGDAGIYFTFRLGRKGQLWRKKHGISQSGQRELLALNDLPETAALEVFKKLAAKKQMQIFFKNRYDIDDFTQEGQNEMAKVMQDICKTGRLGRYSLKILIGKYLIYRLQEAGVGDLVTASYQKTINDINVYLNFSRKQTLERLLSNSYVRENFLTEDIIGNDGENVLITGRMSTDMLKALPKAKIFIFDTITPAGYEEADMGENVIFYNGPFGSKGFTQFLDKMLDDVIMLKYAPESIEIDARIAQSA